MKRLSQNEIESEMEKSIMPQLPRPMSPAELQKLRDDAPQIPCTVRCFTFAYTNEELALLRAAAARKGSPLDDRETAAALGRKYVAADPMGLRRMAPNYVEVQ